MMEMLEGLETGPLLAVIAIFLLLAANFQSFRLSLIVVLTIPSVLAGVALALRLTDTTLNIESASSHPDDSCAMIAGMLPVAGELGAGGGQTAPLGRPFSIKQTRPSGSLHSDEPSCPHKQPSLYAAD
jgi:hypothetical protein